ncbi:MAG: recombinase family protein [Roseiarcus sp.]
MIYGYARVSTDGQRVAAQVKELRAAGAEKVFRETARGAQTDRAQLRGRPCTSGGESSRRRAKRDRSWPQTRRRGPDWP